MAASAAIIMRETAEIRRHAEKRIVLRTARAAGLAVDQPGESPRATRRGFKLRASPTHGELRRSAA